MASIGTTLAIYDQMTAPLNNIRGALEKTTSSLDSLAQSANTTFDDSAYRDLESGLNDISGAIEHAEQTQNGLNSAINQTEESINNNHNQQQQFTEEVQNSVNAMDVLKGVAVKLGGVLTAGKFIKGGMDRLMGVDTAQAKLMALGHNAQGVEMITTNALDSVTGTAFRMEEAVTTAATAVAAGIKPGMQLENYLSLVGDTAAIAGSSMTEMGSIFNKVTTSGRVQTQELNQMLDRGIPIIHMLADEMGVAETQVRELASAGEISSQQFLNAIDAGFGGAAEIMGQASLSAIIDNIGASLGRMSANLINGKNDGIGFFDTMKPMLVDLLGWMRSVEKYFAIVGQVIGTVFNSIISIGTNVANVFINHWGIIQPILWGIIGALVVYNSTMGIAWAIAMKNVAVKIWDTGVRWANAVATFAQKVAQDGLNAALGLGISKWMIYAMVVIALVAIFYAVIAAINHFTGASLSATGLIAGAFAWMGALIMNILIAIVNTGIMTVNLLVNVFQVGIWGIQMAWIGLVTLVLVVLDAIINAGISAAEIVTNTWNGAVYGLQMAFYKFGEFVASIMQAVGQGSVGVINSALGAISNLVNFAISGLNTLIKMANKIKGVDIGTIGEVDLKVGSGVQSTIDNFGSGMTAPTRAADVSFERSSLASDYLGSVNVPEFPSMGSTFDTLDFVDMGSWFDKGYDWGEGMADKVKDFSLTDAISDWLGIEGMEGIEDYDQMIQDLEGMNNIDDLGKGGSSAADKMADSLGNIADNTDAIKNNTGASKEDLKYMRDLSNRSAARRNFQEISINLGGITNQVSKDQDLDGVIDYIVKGLDRAVSASVEGIHH